MKKSIVLLFLLALLALLPLGFSKHRERWSLWLSLQSSPPAWAVDQLTHDFAPFSSISQEALNETFNKIRTSSVSAFRYRILEGKIFRIGDDDQSGRAYIFEKILRRIGRSKKLPNVDFILSTNDGVPETYVPSDFWITRNQAPLFAWAKKKELAPFVVLIPDFLTTKESSWHKEIETIEGAYSSIPWEKRKEVAFWRGASNDKGYTLENYRSKPRFLISLLSSLHPNLIDAAFCRVYPKEVEEEIQNLGLIQGNTPISLHLFYKYLPVLDGYMCTFPGFQWRLLSGSLTLKQESDEIQYFYSALKPYEHYLPIRPDMSDLVEKIRWAKEHDDACRMIAQKARQFAQKNLTPNSIYSYFYWVLQKQSSLQTFDLAQEPMTGEWREIL